MLKCKRKEMPLIHLAGSIQTFMKLKVNVPGTFIIWPTLYYPLESHSTGDRGPICH